MIRQELVGKRFRKKPISINVRFTRDFRETVVERACHDSAFANSLLAKASNSFLNGEPVIARLILRDLVNATIGFEALSDEVSTSIKSLQSMLSERGNPSMNKVAAIFGAISRCLNVKIETSIIKRQQRRQASI